MRDVARDAAGIYQCFVSTAAGTVSAAAKVEVIGRPSSRRDPARSRQHLSDLQNIAPDGICLYTA